MQRPISFAIEFQTPEKRKNAEQEAEINTDLKQIIKTTFRSLPGGEERIRTEYHLLSDYFDGIEVMPDDTKLKINFFPKENANHFWKDLMVRVLRSVARDGTIKPIKNI